MTGRATPWRRCRGRSRPRRLRRPGSRTGRAARSRWSPAPATRRRPTSRRSSAPRGSTSSPTCGSRPSAPATLAPYAVVVLGDVGDHRRPGDGPDRLGQRRRQPGRDASRQPPLRTRRHHRTVGHRRRRLHRGQLGRGARRRDHHGHDAVPRHRQPLLPQRRHRGGDALLQRHHQHRAARGDAAQRRQQRRPGGDVRLRPRTLGDRHAAGQHRLGRSGPRLGNTQPVERPLLRRCRDRLGQPVQGPHPAGRRAAATSRQPRHGDRSRPVPRAEVLVLPRNPQGRRRGHRRRPRHRRHARALQHLRGGQSRRAARWRGGSARASRRTSTRAPR